MSVLYEVDFAKLQDCMFRAVDFIENFLPDHDKPWQLVKLTQPQKDAIDSIQFGFPLRLYDVIEIKISPDGVVMVWPRQCLTGDTQIQLSDGSLKKIEDITTESVVSYNNGFHKSEKIEKINNGIKKCLKIKTRSGRTIKCTENHPFLTCDNYSFMDYKKAEELKVGNNLAMVRHLPNIGSEVLTDKELIFLAYMITEGSLGIYKSFCPRFTNKDHEIVSEWKKIVKNWYQSRSNGNLIYTYSCKNKKLKNLLRKYNLDGKLSGNKFIPQDIFRSTTRQISLFLSKMLDCDGNISNLKNHNPTIEYYSKSKQLIKDLSILFTRIGMFGKIAKHNENYYRLSFTSSISLNNAKKYLKLCGRKQKILDSIIVEGNDHIDTFPLWRYVKQLREKHNLTRREFDNIVGIKSQYIYNLSIKKIRQIQQNFPDFEFDENIYWDDIIEIEDIGDKQTYGLTVYPIHNHITNGFITHNTGKSTACAYAAIALLIIYAGCSIGIISATEKQAKKMYRKIKKILKHSIFWNMVIQKTLKVDFLELNNNSYIEVWPCTDGIEGSTYTYLFADEAALMEEKVLFTSALPTVTHGKRWIMLSTPKGRKGKFIDYYFKGLKTRPIICEGCNYEFPQVAFNVEKFPLGEMPLDEMHPCPFCGSKKYKYGLGIFTIPWVDPWNDGIRAKEKVKRLLDEHDWTAEARQEYLGEIITDASMVFLAEWLAKATDPNLKNYFKNCGFSYVVGIDFGKKHDATCIYVTHRDTKSGHIILDFAMSVAGEYDAERTYRYIRKKVIKVLSKFNPIWMVLDSTGMGDPLVEEIEEDLNECRHKGLPIETKLFCNTKEKGFIISMKSKPELIGNLIKLFSKGRIMIPPTTEPEIAGLKEELLRFEYENVPGMRYIKYGTQSFHDDRVIALALSCWGHRVYPSLMGEIQIGGVKYD